MKSLFRNIWRKKDKSSEVPPTSSSRQHNEQDLTLTQTTSSQRTQATVVPLLGVAVVKEQQEAKTLRRRAKSVGALGKHGPPANFHHGPPLNLTHGPPMSSSMHTPPPRPHTSSTLPKRPSRPPQPLYMTGAISENGRPLLDIPIIHGQFEIPPTPSQPTSNAHRSSHSQKRAKRPLPELGSVWREFLADVQEDIDALEFDYNAPAPSLSRANATNTPYLPPTLPLKTTQSSSQKLKDNQRPSMYLKWVQH